MAAIEWRKICCPVDLSDTARAGLHVAAELCRRFDAELLLLLADAKPKVADELPQGGAVEEQLAAWQQDAERLGATRVSVARAGGPPEVGIVKHAAEAQVDLIVMGTHGRTDRQHMLTGSVAESVVRNAECPVLTIHGKANRAR